MLFAKNSLNYSHHTIILNEIPAANEAAIMPGTERDTNSSRWREYLEFLTFELLTS